MMWYNRAIIFIQKRCKYDDGRLKSQLRKQDRFTESFVGPSAVATQPLNADDSPLKPTEPAVEYNPV